ncbi:MAG: hypothetical protein ACW98K_11060 [Candidatus Kariarchaeaceae archaeon]
MSIDTTDSSDTFIDGLVKASIFYNNPLTPWFLFGSTGHGARITLAMNVKTGKEIGHPSSNYIWDIISVAEHCFPDAGISYQLTISQEYADSSRLTTAQNKSGLPPQVELTTIHDLPTMIQGPVLYPQGDGKWYYSESAIDTSTINTGYMPFGPVFLQITGTLPQRLKFPYSTLKYLINTFERGEKPMEVAGVGNYSAVSGWKAYARWMQIFSIPLPGVIHTNLQQLSSLLLVRRSNYYQYWKELSQMLNLSQELEFADELANTYESMIPILREIVQTGNQLQLIRSLYFQEQKILPIFKRIHNYLRDQNL